MNNEVNSKCETVENELVDKFHDALCPHCNGRCHYNHNYCGYDHTHKMIPAPDVNKKWKRYVMALQGSAKALNKSMDEVYELLTDDNIESGENYEIKSTLQELWRMC